MTEQRGSQGIVPNEMEELNLQVTEQSGRREIFVKGAQKHNCEV